jgi:hypothetical protein
MATPSDAAGARFRGPAVLALTSLGLSALLGACSSAAPTSGPAAAGTSRPASTTAVHAACTQVSAVLSDGPDPDSDPVGYAEAQILPLGQIHTSNAQLRTAIGKLASAYRAFFGSNGKSATAKLAVATASRQINSFCPGAAS